ncbi:hypothetical protein ES703_56514 [subsurface metagenome]
MAPASPNPDPTVRGGQVNTVPAHIPTQPPRHQPNTPVNKKFATAAAPKPKRRTKTKASTPPEPPPEEGITPDEPT